MQLRAGCEFSANLRGIEPLQRLRQTVAEARLRFDVEIPVAQVRDALGQRGTADAGDLRQCLARAPLAGCQGIGQRQQLGIG